MPRLKGLGGAAIGHDMDVSNVSGEGRGGEDGDGAMSSTADYGDEEVALRNLDLGYGEFMVENEALDPTEDEERGIVDDKASLTKRNQDYEEQVPRLLASYRIHQGVKFLEPEDDYGGLAGEWIYCV